MKGPQTCTPEASPPQGKATASNTSRSSLAEIPVVGRDWCPRTSATSLNLTPRLTSCDTAVCRNVGAPSRERPVTPARTLNRPPSPPRRDGVGLFNCQPVSGAVAGGS
jgi:hypothetical protein